VQVCSRSVAVSKNGGGAAIAGTKSSYSLPTVSSQACAEAVTDGMKALCGGKADPVATITSMASTCASAVAEASASSISGAEVSAASGWPPANYTKSAYTTACTSGCANGQIVAQAVAQTSACAFTAQTQGCNSVKTALSSVAYASAFVQTTAKTWSNACALGYGKAHGEGEALAKALVTVLARSFGDIVAKACGECDACKCAPPPAGLTYDNLKAGSDSSAAAANGRFTMAKAFSSAAATYCASDKSPKALKTSVDTAVSTLATMIADVYAKTAGGATASGTALACGGGSVSTKIQAAKSAIITAVADANSVVFAQRCASAYAKLDGMVNLLQDSLDESYDKISNACANGVTGPGSVNAADEVKKSLDSNKPVTAAIGTALQDAVDCGCRPGACIWCAPEARSSNATLSYDFGAGPDSRANVTVPKGLTQLLALANRLNNNKP
jgi:hypothetical protein